MFLKERQRAELLDGKENSWFREEQFFKPRLMDNTLVDGLVSIIMPAWNTADFIAGSIRSILAQTYQDWELVVVDDCSTDHTVEIIESFDDGRIRLFRNEKNIGAAFSRNRALREARGEWIAFLDSDDLWEPEKLEHQIRFMQENNIFFSYHDYQRIDEQSNLLNYFVSGPDVITGRKMRNFCYPGCLTVMYSQKALGLIQIADIRKSNDYAMMLKLCKKADCYRLKENLGRYRVRKVSISHDKIKKKIKGLYNIYLYGENKPALVAFFRTLRNLFFAVHKKLWYEKRR